MMTLVMTWETDTVFSSAGVAASPFSDGSVLVSPSLLGTPSPLVLGASPGSGALSKFRGMASTLLPGRPTRRARIFWSIAWKAASWLATAPSRPSSEPGSPRRLEGEKDRPSGFRVGVSYGGSGSSLDGMAMGFDDVGVAKP